MGPFQRYPPSPRFGIGPLQIDLERGTVSGQDGTGGLTLRAEHLLLLLARYPNLLVTREQILETVWAGRVVEDAAITNCIWQIRKAIGERGKDILQTRAKRGYLLVIADSDWIIDAAPASDAAAATIGDVSPANPATATDATAFKDSQIDAAASAAVPNDLAAADAVMHAAPAPTSTRNSPWPMLVLVALLAIEIVGAALAWRFIHAPPDRILLRPDVEMSMTILAPDRLDWLRTAVLRDTIETAYLRGGAVVLFQKAQTRRPFAGPHLQVRVTRAANSEIDAELTLGQGRKVVREDFRGTGNALAESVQALLTRTLGAPSRQSTPGMDALVSGWVAEQQFDHPRAIEEFRRAIAREPALKDAKIALASALLEQGQGKAALALVNTLLAEPRLRADQRCALDAMLADMSPERLQAKPCARAARIARLGKHELRELLRDIAASQAPKGAQAWLHDETAAILAHIRLDEMDLAEARIVRAQQIADEAGWEHARIELRTLHATVAIHNGQSERGSRLQMESADALEALGDVSGALRERVIALRTMPVVPGPEIAMRRTALRAIVDRARAIGSIRAEIDALYLLARLDRGQPDVWRGELARILELLEQAYPPEQQTRDLHLVLNEMQVQHRYGEVLDGVARIERSGATQTQAQLWNLTLRAESHFARDELDQAVVAVDAMARENFELSDTNPCLFAWLFAEARQPQRARELIRVCRSRQYDRAAQASRADSSLLAEARLYQLDQEPARVWPTLAPRIDALIKTPDLTLREAESLALLARHATGVPGANTAQLQRARDIVEAIAKRDGAGLELRTGAHLLRWRLCAVAAGPAECGPVLPPWALEDRFERRLAVEAAGR